MMYNFLTLGESTPTLLPGILSSTFDVSANFVDVSHADDFDSRNWDAWISCEYTEIIGDLDWSISIYATEDVLDPPAEDELALTLSRSLHKPVLFPSEFDIPSNWRVATPRGSYTFARVGEPNSDKEEFRVEVVEQAMPELPGAIVHKLPEIIKALELDTPITEHFLPVDTEELWDVRGKLINWERLTVRMASGWPPSHWYPPRFYREDLEMRDQIPEDISRLPVAVREQAEAALCELDGIYRDLTADDGGLALADAMNGDVDDYADSPWYWRVRPAKIPWVDEADS